MGEAIRKLFGLDDPSEPTAAQHNYVKQLLVRIYDQAVKDGVEETKVFGIQLDDPPADLEFPPGGLTREIERQTAVGHNKDLLYAGPVPPSGVSFARIR